MTKPLATALLGIHPFLLVPVENGPGPQSLPGLKHSFLQLLAELLADPLRRPLASGQHSSAGPPQLQVPGGISWGFSGNCTVVLFLLPPTPVAFTLQKL